ncbi:MAG: 30S ribosomal protein S17 [Candidatus Micrarchaeota archaeon]|nr:30S ribosomal protein S17 [Candidatus Micrarchaeota archaeon]MDE1834657.1 30S ribosomal protein S17 [Candidatus Micrarchaeota archaeon]MDE1859261.1 30S ribosomal protein S17 [Candidatus Micrarchaeota archaeon]
MECNDPRCPIHGGLKYRGGQLEGRVVSDKAKKTVIVEVDYARYVYKYERSLRKRSRIPAHNPECINAKLNDVVNVAETRRLSKTKSFVVTNIVKK